MKIIDYWIITNALNPPIVRTYFYSATVRITARINGEAKQLGQNLSECIGKTELEAHEKIKSKHQEWLTQISGVEQMRPGSF